MQSSALFNALLSQSRSGAPNLTSDTPLAAEAGAPSPVSASPLFSALQAANTPDPAATSSPKEPDPKNAADMQRGATKSGTDYIDWANLKKTLGIGT